MQRANLNLFIVVVLFMLTACGKGDPAATGKIEDRVKARLTELIGLIKDGKNAQAAKFMVYRGDNKARRWKSVNDYSAADEKAEVDRVCGKLKRIVDLGAPTFVSYESDTESEGTWLVWKVKFGEGDTAKTISMACLEIDGQIALGDVD